jgi:hypothetical protein
LLHDAPPLRDNNIAQALLMRKMGWRNGYLKIKEEAKTRCEASTWFRVVNPNNLP